MLQRFLSRLHLSHKFLLLLVLFALPLGILMYGSLQESGEKAAYTQREIDAVYEIRSLLRSALNSKDPAKLLSGLKPIYAVAESSGLILDSDLYSYSLIEVLTVIIPDIAEHLSHCAQQAENAEELLLNRGVLSLNALPTLFKRVQGASELHHSVSIAKEHHDGLKELLAERERLSESILRATVTPKSSFEPAITEVSEIANLILDALELELLSRLDMQRAARRSTLTILALTAILVPLAALLIVRNITSRLAQLTMATKRSADHGDLSQSVSDDGSDELFTLSQSFNSMIRSLRDVVQKVIQSGSLISSSTVEIAAVSKQQQATAAEIATTTAQIEATSKQIAATSDQLAQTMLDIQDVSSTTADMANAGQQSLEKMRYTMQQITEASNGIVHKLGVLNERASTIGAVVTTIAKVADQTNLLSVNAAIEAEKAGEFGQGFSVVAREIRRLADQTAASTENIERMVREIQSAVSAGVMGMEKFASDIKLGASDIEGASGQLSTIIRSIQTLTPSLGEVTTGMESQALSARQITESLTQLSTAARQTADSLVQSNFSIDQLQQATRLLDQEVRKFHI